MALWRSIVEHWRRTLRLANTSVLIVLALCSYARASRHVTLAVAAKDRWVPPI
ncbi:unnamed protein product, partial [Amoebophrya sp. A25]|eukprot:GSA25T00005045001.1